MSAGPGDRGDPARPGHRRRWLATGDRRAVLVLVAVPLALFVIPALAGHPAIAGDNAIQNFPLRVLAGTLLRQGHLPLWNPYIWSGNPLLGGLNAGAAYPFTTVFAVFPPVAAWTINMLAVYWAGGLGLYVLLRQYRLQPLPCVLAGLTYAFGGAMSGQMVHLGVVQGMGWMPWMVLGLLRLSWALFGTGPVAPAGPADTADPDAGPADTADPDAGPADTADPDAGDPDAGGQVPVGAAIGPGARRSPWPWVVLLAAVFALVILTGEPRAMAEAEVVAAAVVLWLGLRPYRTGPVAASRRAAYLGLSALVGVWGVLIAAVQILPGWAFITASQRATESYTFFAAGSLRPSWTILELVPDLFGGDGLFHQPTWFNSYNLPEVTGYVGLVPLVALVALALRSFGRRREARSSDWGLWLALAVLGLLLTFGSFTPLGHAFSLIPLFGKTRLQSRNLGIVDLALAALLGFWADRALRRRPGRAAPTGRWARAEPWVTVTPALAAVAVCLVTLAVPVTVELGLGADPQGAALGRTLRWWLVAQLVVAAGRGGPGARVGPARPAPSGPLAERGGGGRPGAVHRCPPRSACPTGTRQSSPARPGPLPCWARPAGSPSTTRRRRTSTC